MQRVTHKMKVKRNKGSLQNYAGPGISTLSNLQIFFTSGGGKVKEIRAWLICC